MTKTGKLFLVGFVSLFFWVAHANEPDIQVQATVDRNEVSVGESFTLKIQVNSDQNVRVQTPQLPVIPDVQQIHNWQQSAVRSSVVSEPQGIKWVTIRTNTYNYQFIANKKGTIPIEPVIVKAGDQEFKTAPITIDVLDGQGNPPPSRLSDRGGSQRKQARPNNNRPRSRTPWPNSRSPIDELEERFNQLLQRQFGGVPGVPGGFMTAPRNSKEAFFILAEVDKTEAYKGEQITASWYIYTTGRVRDIDTLKYPTLKGFWKEDIQISTHLNYEQDVVNGVPYNRALLASYALFPIEEGKAKVDPYKAKATIMGGMFSGRGFTATKSSDSIPILIKPLPKEGMPQDFTGAVGRFNMRVIAPEKSVITHQPFPIKIRFEGRGNAKLIELPKLPIGNDLEIYDIKNESKFFKNGESYKEFEVLLIPRTPGELVIGQLNSSFFNPKKGEYVSLRSKPITLTVLPGAKQASIGEERLKSDEVKKALPMIATHWDPDLQTKSAKLTWWAIAFTVLLLFLIGKFIKDSGLLLRQPTLNEVIDKRFVKIEKLLGKSDFRALGIEATNTVYYVVGELSGEGGASEELDKMLRKLPPSVRREIEQNLRKHMEFFGVLGFGPISFVEKFKDGSEVKEKVKGLKTVLHQADKLSRGGGDLEKS